MNKTEEFIERVKERGRNPIFEWTTFLRLHCNESAIDIVNEYLTKPTNRPLILTGDTGMGKDHLMYRLAYLKNLRVMHLSTEYVLNSLRSMKISIEEIDVSVLAKEYEFFRLDVTQLLRRASNPDSWKQFLTELAHAGCKTVMTSDCLVSAGHPEDAIHAQIETMSEHDILRLAKFYFVHEFGYEPQTDEDLRFCSEMLADQERKSCRSIAVNIKRERMMRDRIINEECNNRFLELNSFAALHFHQNLLSLPPDHSAKLWLESRGIGPEAIDLFKIGFAINDWWELPKALSRDELALSDGQAVGLLQVREKSDDRGTHFSVFKNCVIFPIESSNGYIFSFTGRDVESEFGPKYLNPVRSVMLPHGHQFFGLKQAINYIKASGQVIVVEGVTSAIALYMAGFRNVVSIVGTGFHPDQALVLKELDAEVIGWFDGDSCGYLGLYRFLHMLRNMRIPAKGTWFGPIPKPRDYVKRLGLHETKRKISKASTFEELFKSSRSVEPED